MSADRDMASSRRMNAVFHGIAGGERSANDPAGSGPSGWIVHDYLQVNGGAERLVLTLARAWPGFSLGVSGVYREFSASGELSGVDCRDLSGVATILPRIARALTTFSVDRSFLRHPGCVIYSGLFAPLAVRSQRSGKRLCYCHTPPRFAFDREEAYLDRLPFALRLPARAVVARYRTAYLQAIRSMDVVITNSRHVMGRLKRQTGVQAEVVHPPIETRRFRWMAQDGYYVSLGRLEPNKRIDRIVKAFLAMPDKKLVVASGGSEEAALRRLAGSAPNIRFTGWLDDLALAEWIGRSIACLYVPWDEDFGMSAVEAMAAGKPVIACDEGGLRETVTDGQTGFLVPSNPSVESLVQAVGRMTPEVAYAMRAACEVRAGAFALERFLSAMSGYIE